MTVFEQLIKTPTLDAMNALLTDAMAQQKIQSLIKDDGLLSIVARVLELAADQEPIEELRTAALLSRLAAVTRNRAEDVLEAMPEVVTSNGANIDDLSDGDEKLYAAKALAFVKEEWLAEYCVQQAVAIESADAARKQLLQNAFERTDDPGQWIEMLANSIPSPAEFPSATSYLRRARRILAAIGDVLKDAHHIPGMKLTESASKLGSRVFVKNCRDSEEEVLFTALDLFLMVLMRILEARLSLSLDSKSYESLTMLKRVLGPGLWAKYLRSSTSIGRIRVFMCEASLILAKQSRTDRGILDALLAIYVSKPQLNSQLSAHFEQAKDVEADVANWWVSAGEAKASSNVSSQPIGNNEDRQIGELLLQIESYQATMKALPDTVVPVLRMHDDVSAATVQRAVSAFLEMAQIIRRLARMRRLSRTDLKESVIEYNPREHEMIGGHQAGVRMVRVVRDGVRKSFGGSEKYLAKPQVEPHK